jgi:hypothetical protein
MVNYTIYAWEFTKINTVYVGIAKNLKRRISNHRCQGPVNIFAIENGYNLKEMSPIILEECCAEIVGERELYYWNLYNDKKWINLGVKHKCGNIGSIGRLIWTKDKCLEEAQKYKTRNNFKKGSPRAYDACRKKLWLDDVCSHMKPKPTIWTKERCTEEALKYESRSSFKANSSGAYSKARANGWLNDICKHMLPTTVVKSNSRRYWTKERCTEEALKYSSRNKFCLGSKGAYSAACSNGWLDEACKHMK